MEWPHERGARWYSQPMFFDCTCGLATAVLSLATDLLRALAVHDVHACLLRTTVCGVASLSAFCCRCDVIVIEVEEACYCSVRERLWWRAGASVHDDLDFADDLDLGVMAVVVGVDMRFRAFVVLFRPLFCHCFVFVFVFVLCRVYSNLIII